MIITMEKVNNSDTSVDLDAKATSQIQEKVPPPAYNDDGPHFDAARTKKLLRKLDWHLVPFLSLLYL